MDLSQFLQQLYILQCRTPKFPFSRQLTHTVTHSFCNEAPLFLNTGQPQQPILRLVMDSNSSHVSNKRSILDPYISSTYVVGNVWGCDSEWWNLLMVLTGSHNIQQIMGRPVAEFGGQDFPKYFIEFVSIYHKATHCCLAALQLTTHMPATSFPSCLLCFVFEILQQIRFLKNNTSFSLLSFLPSPLSSSRVLNTARCYLSSTSSFHFRHVFDLKKKIYPHIIIYKIMIVKI